MISNVIDSYDGADGDLRANRRFEDRPKAENEEILFEERTLSSSKNTLSWWKNFIPSIFRRKFSIYNI